MQCWLIHIQTSIQMSSDEGFKVWRSLGGQVQVHLMNVIYLLQQNNTFARLQTFFYKTSPFGLWTGEFTRASHIHRYDMMSVVPEHLHISSPMKCMLYLFRSMVLCNSYSRLCCTHRLIHFLRCVSGDFRRALLKRVCMTLFGGVGGGVRMVEGVGVR